MAEIEKVIKGLRCHVYGHPHTRCHDCPYWGTGEHGCSECDVLASDALELLKEQQKHDGSFVVIDTKTGKEADQYNIALHEDWAKHLCYCDMDGWAIQDDGSLLLLDECGRFTYADRERFKVKWNA